MPLRCKVCGFRRATRQERCEPCYRFWLRVGRDKTPREVRAGHDRVMGRIERALEPPPPACSVCRRPVEQFGVYLNGSLSHWECANGPVRVLKAAGG